MSVRSLRYNTMNQHITKSALASTDRDALAFLEAAQIYNANQQRAIVNLVRSLKRVGLWSKMKAIYPFVGGTATSHKFNLKDPRDADAAFRLTFSGGWTHSSTGATPNGTNAYGDTFIIPNTDLGAFDNVHISYYSRKSGTTGPEIEIGVQHTSGDARRISMLIAYKAPTDSGNTYMILNENGFASWPDFNGRAYYIMKRVSSENIAYRNDVQVANRTPGSGTTKATFKLFIAANNEGGTAKNFSSKETAFMTIGDGMTNTEAVNLYNIVDLYQKRLGRAV